MDLGEKLKQARLEAGLSQRQLCGDEITRNMLSQIENGTARPSMTTLRYLAERLGKPISWFLDEQTVTSPNQQVMAEARAAHQAGKREELGQALDNFQGPDPVFDAEYLLLKRLYILETAEKALNDGKPRYAAQLLDEAGPFREGYCGRELERQRLLLLAGTNPGMAAQILPDLPDLDRELLVRAEAELERGTPARCLQLLDAVEDRSSPKWNYLRGEAHFARREYELAAACYLKGEQAAPERALLRLEACYRELGNFERAYFYACARRDGRNAVPHHGGEATGSAE